MSRAARLAVLDYGIGNLRSAQKAFEVVGAQARLTADRDEIEAADGVVLPGVGAFGRCVEALGDAGLCDVAVDAVRTGRPFLGICVGMQMLYAGSAESPGVAGLGVLDGKVELLGAGVKRPQMQWNVLSARADVAMLAGLDGEWVYFVHSYAVTDSPDVVATCDYGGPVVAAVARDNVWATQFHPEKSGRVGLRLLSNFARYAGAA